VNKSNGVETIIKKICIDCHPKLSFNMPPIIGENIGIAIFALITKEIILIVSFTGVMSLMIAIERTMPTHEPEAWKNLKNNSHAYE